MKKAFALIICFALCLSLCACHGKLSRTGFTIPDSFDESKNYTVTFWAKNDTNKTQVAIYKNAIEQFEKLYPNITVEIKMYTDYNNIYNDVISNIQTGTTPDVCVTYPDHIATYLAGEDTVVPLDELLDDKKYGLGGSEIKFDSPTKDEIIPEFLSECRINGVLYALPFMRSTEACYVNRDFVEKLGYTLPETLTWDFVWEVSHAALEKNADGTFKVNGQNVMIPFIYKSTDNMMISVLRQLGAPYSDADGSIGMFSEETKNFLLKIAPYAKEKSFSTFKISSYPANFLNAGQCIFAIDSTAGATWMGAKAPLVDIPKDKIVDFNTEVMTIPQYDTDNPAMISQGPSICVFNKSDPGQTLAAWIFAQYLLTNETQIAYSQTEGYVPVTSKAQNDPQYVDYLSREGEDNSEHYDVKIKAAKLLLENTPNTFVTAVFNGSASLRNAAGQLIEEVTKAQRRGKTVDGDYIDGLYKNMISLYRLDSVSAAGSGKAQLGALPAGAKALFICLGTAWAGIIIYACAEKIRKKKKAEE